MSIIKTGVIVGRQLTDKDNAGHPVSFAIVNGKLDEYDRKEKALKEAQVSASFSTD
jgi:hypothetical protein